MKVVAWILLIYTLLSLPNSFYGDIGDVFTLVYAALVIFLCAGVIRNALQKSEAKKVSVRQQTKTSKKLG